MRSAVNTPAARATTSSSPTVFFASPLVRSSRTFTSLWRPVRKRISNHLPIYRNPCGKPAKPLNRDRFLSTSAHPNSSANLLNPTVPAAARFPTSVPYSQPRKTNRPSNRLWVAQRSQRCDQAPPEVAGFSPRGAERNHLLQPQRFRVAQRFQRCDQAPPEVAGFSPRSAERNHLLQPHLHF